MQYSFYRYLGILLFILINFRFISNTSYSALLYYFLIRTADTAKIGIDARFTGHELHHKLSYTLYLSSSGDRTDRYIPRFNEIIETNKINYLCLCLLLLHLVF